ncbi:MAG: beta-lactamase family protein [Victivallales bacterium]|nr:beta-lactamase family protein [Victivallales bacterium]
MFEKLNELLNSFLEMGIPGYDIVVRHHGEVIYRRMGGFSDLKNSIPMRGDELYYIYSCSKPITCVAAMQLYEKGLFRLEDELWHYLPEYENMTIRTPNGILPAKNKITIKHLFTMTAGMNYDRNATSIKEVREKTNGRCPTREIIRGLARENLSFEPGANWQYSLCHDVIVALVEVITGMKFNDYATKHIFAPLGMNNTSYILTPEFEKRVAPLYAYSYERKAFELYPDNFYIFGPEYASGGAGCMTTVDDMSLFLEALRTGDSIIRKDTLRLMTTDMLNDAIRPSYWKPLYGYGLGMRCPYPPVGDKTDFGWGGAAGAWLGIDWTYDYSSFYAQHVLYSPNAGMRDNIPDIVRDELRRG